MSEMNFTQDQLRAIEARGTPVLVSAGAGSGKTKVLIERLLQRVLEGVDIDRFLVITFTRAAAAELRGRILRELGRLSAGDPSDRHLRRQSALLYRAQIGTIDSFCASVLRENAQLAELSPTFSVLDEDRSAQLLARSLDEVMDRAYESMGDDPAFRGLVNSVGAGLDDSVLAEAVLSLYKKLQGRAWPRAWAEEKLGMLDMTGVTDAGRTPWGAYLLEDAASSAALCAERLEAAAVLMTKPGDDSFMDGYRESFSLAAALHRDFIRESRVGWEAARRALETPHPPLSRKRKNVDEELRERVKPVWDESRETLSALRSLFARSSAELLPEIERTKPMLRVLTELVFRLEEEYAERKRRADACDFSDVEHLCLRLLSQEENGAAARLSARFAEVMVDEYQDVNEVQEQIFRCVSGGGQRLFMVGDVKQSIYRFRLAEPEIFRRKYESFGRSEDTLRVDLRENFRSRGSVLDACNAVFRRIMSPALGDVAYDDRASLIRGESYYPCRESEKKTELCIVDRAGAGRAERETLEPRYVAERIRAMVAAGELVHDGAGGMRPVEYGDIAILLRTANRTGGAYRRALAEAGIPVTAQQGGSFFALPEIRFCAAMLAAADNPRQDVPLIAAMRGLPFAFTPDELSAVRASDREGDIWDAVLQRAETDEKCARFAAAVNTLRDLAREEPTEALLRWLYDRTGLYAACAAMPDGLRRGAALMQLYEYARRFEEEGGRGLFRFVARLRRLEEEEADPPLTADGGAVRILSIHKSKGLEYPVVFLSDLNRAWTDHGHAQVRSHGELGLGMRLTDEEAGVNWATLPLTAIRRREKREELSEWERLLYVGMTRAQERLILTCTADDAAETVEKLGGPSEEALPPQLLAKDANISRWLMRAAAADGGRTVELRCVTPEDGTARMGSEEGEAAPRPCAAPGQVRALRERLAWRYPAEASASIPSKLTATGLRAAEDPEALPMERRAASGERPMRRIELGRGDEPLTGTERGVATHLVMQHIDFARVKSARSVAAEIERLREQGFLNEKQAAAVPPEEILAFFVSELGRRVLASEQVYREFRFSLLCPAKTWYPEADPGEEILLQGVVDLCFRELDGSLTVVDFKTDVRAEPERYAEQLGAYAMAMERITGSPVRRAALWYLRLRRAEELPRQEKTVAFSGEM